jgi:hypothetical protein
VDFPYRGGDPLLERRPGHIYADLRDYLTVTLPAILSDRDVFVFNFVDHGRNELDLRNVPPLCSGFVGSALTMTYTDPIYFGQTHHTSSSNILLDQVNDGIDAYQKVYLLQPCNSGGMIGTMHVTGIPDPRNDDKCKTDFNPNDPWTNWWIVDGVGQPALSNTRTVILASVRWNEDNNWLWMEHVSEALFACDDTGDAFCSYEEAFREAFGAVPPGEEATQHPPLDDNADGVGHSPDESGYQPDVVGEDGYLARRSYL